MEKYIIIVAGGSGTRMNTIVPKQFIAINGKPVLMHTMEKFIDAIPEIKVILVLPSDYMMEWKQMCKNFKFYSKYQIAEGGKTRFHSVKSGLEYVPEKCLVGIHDAARPLVSHQTITHTFAEAEKKGNACPAISLNESIREVKNKKNKAVDRSNYFIVQTPQCFKSSLLKKAFLQDYKSSFTDDASVFEAMGKKINLVEGNRENIKITTPHDLFIAEALIRSI